MSRVYVINIGANNSHSSTARSPHFANGSFRFVSFPDPGGALARNYPRPSWPFIRTTSYDTHDDPDWENLTYGDDCGYGRAGALQQVNEGDILLFWGMLWRNLGNSWEHFDGHRGWYLLGSLRVAEILEGGHLPTLARPEHRARAERNVHFRQGPLPLTHRVFIGDARYSTLFDRAVDLEVSREDGLLYRTMHTANGQPLALNGTPKWYSSLRSCRSMWDLDVSNDRLLAAAVRDRIQMNNEYDLLADIAL